MFQILTFFQLRSLIERGGVGAESLLFKLTSKPTGLQPEAVVLSSTSSRQVPYALDLRNSTDLLTHANSDRHKAKCFLASSKPLPCGFLMQTRAW